jgi:hypothetical protein
MERVSFITHAGRQILFVDMSNTTPEEIIQISNQVQDTVTGQPKASVLILVDLTGAQLDKKAIVRFKEAAAYDRPYVKRSAMIGAGEQHKALTEGLKIFSQRDYRYFQTKEEALKWLVE